MTDPTQAALIDGLARDIRRLREQLRIAEEFLETLARRKRGEPEPYPGHDMTFAEDALIQMSVVE
jgi:hypothetical protein